MIYLNSIWLFLGLLACLTGLLTPDGDSVITLYWGVVLVSLPAFWARGLGLFLWELAAGIVGTCRFYRLSDPDMAWAPLVFGAMLAIYNLGSGRRITPTVALSQLAILLAPVPTLAFHLSWQAIPAGLAAVALAGFAAFGMSALTWAYESEGLLLEGSKSSDDRRLR